MCNMMIDKLSIQGFKSIRDATVEFKNLNVIIGANGSGKSNLLQVFQVLREKANNNLEFYIKKYGDISSFLHNGIQCTPKISIAVGMDGEMYKLVLIPTANEYFQTRESLEYDEEAALCVREHSAGTWQLENMKSKLSASRWVVHHFHDTSSTAPMRYSEITDDYHVGLRADAANIAPFLLHLKNQHPKNYTEIVETIQLVIPFFEDFCLDVFQSGPAEKVKLRWKQKNTDYPMQPYHLSDGSIRFICLTAFLLQPSLPPLIILDEPELGLHYSALAILAELVEYASRFTQVILATQSPAFVNYFILDDLIVARRKDGASTFARLEENDYNVWLKEDRVGDLWAMNTIRGGVVYE